MLSPLPWFAPENQPLPSIATRIPAPGEPDTPNFGLDWSFTGHCLYLSVFVVRDAF
jgi:hypothetical protein